MRRQDTASVIDQIEHPANGEEESVRMIPTELLGKPIIDLNTSSWHGDAEIPYSVEDSSSVFTRELRTQVKFRAYKARIEELREFAAEDGFQAKSESLIDFWKFIRSEQRIRRGNLVLIDNGNLRAVWKDNQGTYLGLQFLGGEMVQYVIFKQRGTTKPISRVAGRDNFDGLKRQIGAFDLDSLLYK